MKTLSTCIIIYVIMYSCDDIFIIKVRILRLKVMTRNVVLKFNN